MFAEPDSFKLRNGHFWCTRCGFGHPDGKHVFDETGTLNSKVSDK